MSPPVIATLVRSGTAREALRRAIPRQRARLRACRSGEQLGRVVATTLADAVVADPRAPGAREALLACRREFPRVPRFVYASFRPDDGVLLLECLVGFEARPIVEGVEEAALGELVLPLTASALRLAALEGAPGLLRLTDPLQSKAFAEVMRRVGGRLRTTDIARALRVSREHLSRQFGAGGAPNLKRVIDLARVITAADLLANPGHSVRSAAAILGFASASHLSVAARRVAGVTARELPHLGPRGVLRAFLRGRTRSRH